jgi:hypothetical protein
MDNALAVKGKTQKVMAGNSWAGGGKHNVLAIRAGRNGRHALMTIRLLTAGSFAG